ncbi:MAG: hypothetical protein ACO37D_07460, partial [Rhodothermales bacterium]
MSLELIRSRIASAAFSRRLVEWASESSGDPNGSGASVGRSLSVRGAVGSLPAFLTATVFLESSRPVLCLLPDEDAAAFFGSDLQQILGSDEQVMLLPVSDNRPFDPEHMPDP